MNNATTTTSTTTTATSRRASEGPGTSMALVPSTAGAVVPVPTNLRGS